MKCKERIEERAAGQPFYLCALEAIFDLAGGPDSAVYHSGINSFAALQRVCAWELAAACLVYRLCSLPSNVGVAMSA